MTESDLVFVQYASVYKLNMDDRWPHHIQEWNEQEKNKGHREKWVVLHLLKPKTFWARLYDVWKREKVWDKCLNL